MNNKPDITALFAEYVSGTITDVQLRELEISLTQDAELRSRFIKYLNLDSALSDHAALSSSEVAEIESCTQQLTPLPARQSRMRINALTFATAVAAAIVLAFFLWPTGSSPSQGQAVATIVADVDAVLHKSGQPDSGSELFTDEYTLEEGLINLEFAGGVMVYIEAPARFKAASDKKILLHSGQLSASVPQAGIGFTVETPDAEVVDFGTEFSVDVGSGASEVHVFDGLVRIAPRLAGNENTESIDLRTDQAVRLDRQHPDPVMIDVATDRFIRNFDEPHTNRFQRMIQSMSPVAHYGMPIQKDSLACDPPDYEGKLIRAQGASKQSRRAKGISGSSLRVQAGSNGMGGVVDTPIPLYSGELTLIAHVYLENQAPNGTIITDTPEQGGRIMLGLDEVGGLTVAVQTETGQRLSITQSTLLPLQTWVQVIVISDGEKLRLYSDGQLVGHIKCGVLNRAAATPLWFGTRADGEGLWSGRIDEVAFIDRAITKAEIEKLHEVAVKRQDKFEDQP